MSKVVVMIRELKDFLEESPANKTELLALICDIYQFVLYNKACIEDAPLQVHYSALIFSPQASIIRRLFQAEIPPWLKTPKMLNEHWSPCLQVFEGHTHSILSVAFSPDSRQLVSASAIALCGYGKQQLVPLCGRLQGTQALSGP